MQGWREKRLCPKSRNKLRFFGFKTDVGESSSDEVSAHFRMDPSTTRVGHPQVPQRRKRMRKSRYALVAALACGTVLGTSSLAFADGAADNISSIEAGVSPNYQSSTKAGPATLFSQVQTFDA